MIKKQFIVFSLVISTFTINAQIVSSYGSGLLAMLQEKVVNGNLDGLIQSYQKHVVLSKMNLLETPSDISLERSYITFKTKDRKEKKHLFRNFSTKNSNILIDRQSYKNKRQAKRISLNSKTLLNKHSKELKILNGATCYDPSTTEYLCLNLPERYNYKVSTMQDEEKTKGDVQESAITIGKLPQGVYLLDAWSLGEHQKEKLINK